MEGRLGARPADLSLGGVFEGAPGSSSAAERYVRALRPAGVAPLTALRHTAVLGRAAEAFLARPGSAEGLGAVADAPSVRGLVLLEGELRREARPRGAFA